MNGNPAPAQQLHTAEHIFARSLQNEGIEIHVRKVDTIKSSVIGEAFIKEIIPLEKIVSAELETNKIINSALDVGTENFDGVENAKEKFPSIRFNEDRLKDAQTIRVIKIGDYDTAACSQEHVLNTREIIAFSIFNVTYPNGETKIVFKAGMEAIEHMLRVKAGVLEVSCVNNFDAERIKERYISMQESSSVLNEDIYTIITKVIGSLKKPALYVNASSISVFHRPLSDYVNKNSYDYFIVFNDSQLFGVKGRNCTVQINEIGEYLKKAGAFIGAIKSDSISGKITDIIKTKEYLQAKDI